MIVTAFMTKEITTGGKNVYVKDILKRFKTEDKNNISDLKFLPEHEYKEAKSKLPVVCFGGTFSTRSKSGLLQASGLMILDFDKVDMNYIEELKSNQFVYSAFMSPSGKGYKALIKIPVVKSDEEYKLYYNAVMEEFPLIDTSGQDISRACFFSYDPDLYLNEGSLTFNKKKKPQDKQPIRVNANYIKNNDLGIANRILKIIRFAIPGEMHNKLLKASRLMGGYVASNKIDFEMAKMLLEEEVKRSYPDEHNSHFKTIVDGLQHGQNDPIEDSEEVIKKEEIEHRYGKIYYTVHDKTNDIIEEYNNGIQRGYEVGFDCLKDLYTVKRGSTTYLYGAPYSGKSQVWFEFLINLSKSYGLLHAIFSPETGRAHEIFIELIEMVAKQDFYDTYGNKMDVTTRDEAMKFVDQHFIVIDPESKPMNIDDFYDVVDIVERVYKCQIFSTTVDPWNELRHDFKNHNGRQDQYLEWALGEIRENARRNNRHNCIITHVQDQQIQKSKEGVFYYSIPTFREIAGGQAWSRKGMAMIAVWRPVEGLYDENGEPYAINESIISVQKSKPKGTGKVGKASLLYDSKSHRYKENYAFGTKFALEFKEKLENKEEKKDNLKSYVPADFYEVDRDEVAPF